ncbi:MAG: ABC transporter ATP-binding protein [Lachnospiraceae bacterium]|uniref:ABC transporter ATP-binding protein n=1 Tax=Candidatus Weimeria bifida TaxID=2599074 RepID=A0A6N7IX56_9FIRM|nr:ABC transporter ATP-binding protein [Candidatus Weimeria bifida]RRF97243.1 MAG: ABC transporter ATP-binding protein [Lachnospiraceae bacterium]
MTYNEKKNEHTHLKKAFAGVIKKNKGLLIGLIALIVASVVASLIPPLVLEQAVNRLGAGKGVSLTLALWYFLFIVISDLLESLQNAGITVFGQKITHGIRSALCQKLSRLPAEYFHRNESGKTASIFTNDGDTIDVLYSDGVVSMAADLLKVVGILIVIYTRSLGLGLLVTAVTPLLFWFTRTCQRRSNRANLENRRAIARVNGHVPETLRCIRMIRVFHAQRHMENVYSGYIKESYDAVDRSNVIDSIYSPVILLTQAAVTAAMMIFAAGGNSYRALFGISVGTAVAMMAYVNRIFSPLENIGMEIQNIQSAAAAIDHIDTFLEEPEWQPEITEPKKTDEIRFEHVDFGYQKDRPVLKDLSFDIKKGELVTFAGRTGAGKTTVFRLLTGLYEPDRGTVNLAGLDPCALSQEERRRVIGYVEQNFASVPGTVKDQITLYDSDISNEEIDAALKLAGLKDVIEQLPDGLDTKMSERLFSKGQLQLLSIARAVVLDPQILLLDEVTASLDAKTEAGVIRALKSSARGRTVLTISHRLSEAIGDARIIEIGT